jgi:hypothetical protein
MVLPTDGTDVAGEFNAQVQAAPNGSTIIIPAGRFVCDFPLLMVGKVGVTLRGAINADGLNGAERHFSVFVSTLSGFEIGVTKGSNSARRHFTMDGCDDCTVTGMRIESTNTVSKSKPSFATYYQPREFEHGFVTKSSRRCTLHDVSTYGTWGDGVTISGSKNFGFVEDFVAYDVWIDWCGRQGVAVGGATNTRLYNFHMDAVRRSAVDLEPHSDDLHIDGFEMYDSEARCLYGLIASKGRAQVDNIHFHDMYQVPTDHETGLNGGTQRHCLVQGSHNEETGLRPIRKNWLVERITCPSNGGAWQFVSCENVILRDIHAPNLKGRDKWGAPVRFYDCIGDLEVSGCYFRHHPDSPAYAGDGDEIWQINSSDVAAFDNAPEMMILTEKPTERPGDRGWTPADQEA